MKIVYDAEFVENETILDLMYDVQEMCDCPFENLKELEVMAEALYLEKNFNNFDKVYGV